MLKDLTAESKKLAENYETKIIETIDLKYTQLETKINDMDLRFTQLENRINNLHIRLSGGLKVSNVTDEEEFWFPPLHFDKRFIFTRDFINQFKFQPYNEVEVYLAMEEACLFDPEMLDFVRSSQSEILGFTHKAYLFAWLVNRLC